MATQTAETDAGAAIRKIAVPPNRQSPLRKEWMTLIKPLTTELQLAVQYNVKTRQILLAPGWVVKGAETPDASAVRAVNTSLEKATDYVKAYLSGFEINDALALLRLEDIYLQSFKVTDVRRLPNENMSRAIGRIAGKEGKTKNAIQNATRTRIVIADKTIHLLGSFENIILARESICSLIIGRSPTKVYNHLRIVARRMKERGF